jgi:hypothetical protein
MATLHRAIERARLRGYDIRRIGAKTRERMRVAATATALAENALRTVEDDLLFIPPFLRRSPKEIAA